MSVEKGVDGSILIGTDKMAHIKSWEWSPAGDALETTCFGEKDRTSVPGLRSHAVTFAGDLESTGVAQKALLDNFKSTAENTAATVILLTNSTTGSKKGWTGSGPITGLAIGNAAEGLVAFSGTIQISGGMSTYTTST